VALPRAAIVHPVITSKLSAAAWRGFIRVRESYAHFHARSGHSESAAPLSHCRSFSMPLKSIDQASADRHQIWRRGRNSARCLIAPTRSE